MTLKIEFDQPGGKVTLECSDGENVILNGPFEKVSSKNLEKAMEFIVKILRIANKEQEPDSALLPYQDWMEIICTKEAFEESKLRDIQFANEQRIAALKDIKDFKKSVEDVLDNFFSKLDGIIK